MIALGYVRRSKESEARTISLEVQETRIATYCTEHGWELADTVRDDGVSGGRRDRLVRLRARVKELGAERVVVYHVDRLARDVEALFGIIRALAKLGVEVHDVHQGALEVRSSNGVLTTGMHGLVAEHFRALVSEKTSDALRRLRSLGFSGSGRVPYGYRALEWVTNGDGKAHRPLVPDPHEQAVFVQIQAFHAEGLSLRQISRGLADRGILARSGRPFTASTLAPLVRHRTIPDRPVHETADTSPT